MFLKARTLLVVDEKHMSDIDMFLQKLTNINFFKYFKTTQDNIYNKDQLKIFLKTLPQNTVFSKNINTDELYLSLPFYSSHIKMPIKPNEHVWIYPYIDIEDDPIFRINSYWLGRPHSLLTTEDTTYNYSDRDTVTKHKVYLDESPEKAVEVYSGFVDSDASANEQFKEYKEKIKPEQFIHTNYDDFSIRGSSNNIVKLSNSDNNSEISLVAGINSRSSTPSTNLNVLLKVLDDEGFEEKGVMQEMPSYASYNTQNNMMFINANDHKQTIKRPELLFGKYSKSVIGERISPKQINFENLYDGKNDSSKITISSSENYSKVFSDFGISSFLDDTDYKAETIALLSTDIGIGALNGKLSLTNNNSAIKLNSDNINAIANKIEINSGNVLIGLQDTAEPSPKGNLLVSDIKKIINIQKETLNLIKEISLELTKHQHIVHLETQPFAVTTSLGPGNGQFLAPVSSDAPTINLVYETAKDEIEKPDTGLIAKLEKIKFELENILSNTVYIS